MPSSKIDFLIVLLVDDEKKTYIESATKGNIAADRALRNAKKFNPWAEIKLVSVEKTQP